MASAQSLTSISLDNLNLATAVDNLIKVSKVLTVIGNNLI